jgi:hypothetical protein
VRQGHPYPLIPAAASLAALAGIGFEIPWAFWDALSVRFSM